jgi:hypothetical protein
VCSPWQDHDDSLSCSRGLAMSGGDGMDSILECVLPDTCGFLPLRPFMTGA